VVEENVNMMKVALVANISANGKVLLSDHPDHQLPPEAMAFYLKLVHQVGNVVIGVKTFKNFLKFPPHVRALFESINITVLSDRPVAAGPYKVVGTPEEAIAYLSGQGFEEVAIGGGTTTFNAFLERDLVSDIYFNISPVIIGDGAALGNRHDLHLGFKMIGCEVNDNYTQLHFTRV
jgi:dihydrofolate reductase